MPLLWKESTRTKRPRVSSEIKRPFLPYLQETLAQATSLLDESLAISSELGMRPLMERVLSRREILKAEGN